jgi:hypothetical protein
MNIYPVSFVCEMFRLHFFENLVREALRQINIQMIDSSNIYDGLETLWLGSADESLSSQQVNSNFCKYKYSDIYLGYC